MTNPNDLIRRGDAEYAMQKHAHGETVLGGQTYKSLTLEVASEAINAIPAITVGVRPITDGEINVITLREMGRWPSFEAQSWACKVVHAVLAAPEVLALVEAAKELQSDMMDQNGEPK